ncbi:MAG: uncharacterized protein A8A55_1976 [Amphiamblys sp. WSBS2006]|nr:MAG: uncharacterized protein A8A55_1976 [Amphiamblys sp. WSBS2006]
MFDLAHESFAKHGDSFFLEESGGVLVVSEALWESERDDVKKKRQFLYEQRQEVLEVAKQRVLEEPKRKNLARHEDSEANEEELSELVTQLQIPDSFSLTQNLPNEAILLTEKTTVTLSKIAISVKLFLVLLEKTRVTVGERFSITKHASNEDCIRENNMARKTPFCLERRGAVSNLALENIERMPPNSIGCVLEEVMLVNTGLINILPKLRIHEDSEIEWLELSADEEEHVAAILTKDQPIYIRRVKKMELWDYAVGILPKLRVHEGSEVEWLKLSASKKEHVAAILTKDQTFCVGRVKNMWLWSYAVGILPKLRVHEGSEVEWLKLSASKKEHVAAILTKDQTFCVGRVKNMWLWSYAAGVITKIKIHENCEVEKLSLYTNEEEHVAPIFTKDQPFCIGRVKGIRLREYAVRVVTKTGVNENNGVEELSLSASKEEHVAITLAKDQSIYVGRVKKLELRYYAVIILPAFRIHKDNTMEEFVLVGRGEHLYKILWRRDNSIELGRIRKSGFRVQKETRQKLRYTLVDGEGNEVLEENIFFRNKAAVMLVLFLVICFSSYLRL